MKTIKKSVLALAIASALVSGSANAFVSYWLDADGPGANAAPVRIGEFLDIVGRLDVQNTYTYTNPAGPYTYTFMQYGLARVSGVDSMTLADALDAGLIDTPQSNALGSVGVKFFGPGSGTLGQSIAFTGGTIDIYAPTNGYADAHRIATFAIQGGGGAVNPLGVPNGQSTLISRGSALKEGYWFLDAGGVIGKDLYSAQASDFLLGFATTNLSSVARGSGTETSILNAINSAYGTAFTTPTDNAQRLPNSLVLGANGQWRMDIPEPASLALVALGLLGMGTLRRRRST